MIKIRVKEDLDRRCLGALCFTDRATGSTIRRSMNIHAEGLNFIINPSWLHVIESAKGLEHHNQSFSDPPDLPAQGSLVFQLTITDPLLNYLPRTTHISLPRNPDPASEDNLFEPIRIPMYSAASGKLSPNWSIVRASVYDSEDDDLPIRGALLRIIREEDDVLIASGLTDIRGEALIIVPGIPIHNFVTEEMPIDDDELDHDDWLAAGEVVEKETSVILSVVVDNSLPWPVDPELLEENNTDWLCMVKDNWDNELENDVNLKLKTGQTRIIKLFVEVPDGI